MDQPGIPNIAEIGGKFETVEGGLRIWLPESLGDITFAIYSRDAEYVTDGIIYENEWLALQAALCQSQTVGS